MISLNEIIDTYAEYRHIHIISGEPCVQVFHPQLLMDIELTLFDRRISKIDCKGRLQKLRSNWREIYTKFNKDFFLPFSQEQKDYIIEELMDGYQDWIADELDDAIKQAKRVNGNFPEFMLEDMATTLLCYSMANSACKVWETLYRRSKRVRGKVYTTPVKNDTLEALAKTIQNFAKEYIKQKNGHDEEVVADAMEDYEASLDSLTARLLSWPKLNELA